VRSRDIILRIIAVSTCPPVFLLLSRNSPITQYTIFFSKFFVIASPIVNPLLTFHTTSTTPPYLKTPISTASYQSSPPSHHYANFPKKTTNVSVYRTHFLEILNCFPDATLCFTDGSNIGNRTGFAYSINNKTFSYRHRNSASILTVELQAIFQCLESILSLLYPTPHTFLIASNSFTALTTISNIHSFHPIAHTVLTTRSSLSQSVTFIWIPSHRGIQGNEVVDSAAKAATNFPRINSRLLPTKSDLTLFIRQHITKYWISLSQNQALSNKLGQIKPLPFSWPSSHQRFRITNTCLTHAHLLTNLFPLSCEHCKLDSSSPSVTCLRAPPSHLSVTPTESTNSSKWPCPTNSHPSKTFSPTSAPPINLSRI